MPVSNISQERLAEINKQMLQAGAIGILKGTLVGLVTGYFFNYRYNHGPNTKFFLRPYKIWYLVSCGIVGLSFSAETARMRITRDLAEEENIRRNQFFSEEIGGRK